MKLDESLKTLYDSYYSAGVNDWRWIGARDKTENIINLCSHVPHNSICEIGAGEGAILHQLGLANFGEQLFALEISASGVESIQQRGIQRLVESKLFDGYTIPYSDQVFDLAVLSHVVEHVEHPRTLLYEARRIAPYVFVEVPLEDNLRLPHNYLPTELGHINFYSPRSIRNLLQSSGFEVLEQIVTNRSKDTYTYQSGPIKGTLAYGVKQTLLKGLPGVATRLFTYHSALLCRSQQNSK
jgi:ubiquinone/menaquinone biosynthesis C-methylase UbiE